MLGHELPAPRAGELDVDLGGLADPPVHEQLAGADALVPRDRERRRVDLNGHDRGARHRDEARGDRRGFLHLELAGDRHAAATAAPPAEAEAGDGSCAETDRRARLVGPEARRAPGTARDARTAGRLSGHRAAARHADLDRQERRGRRDHRARRRRDDHRLARARCRGGRGRVDVGAGAAKVMFTVPPELTVQLDPVPLQPPPLHPVITFPDPASRGAYGGPGSEGRGAGPGAADPARGARDAPGARGGDSQRVGRRNGERRDREDRKRGDAAHAERSRDARAAADRAGDRFPSTSRSSR